MKILPTKIKRWSFSQRLEEIESRLSDIDNYNEAKIPWELKDRLHEIRQIVRYWRAHMKNRDDKPKEKKPRKKSVNLWE